MRLQNTNKIIKSIVYFFKNKLLNYYNRLALYNVIQ